jgi:hypothetical protein
MPRLVLAPILLALLVPTLASAQARLVLEPASLDFGAMTQRETRDAEVILRNEGSEPLRIVKVDATCGCTVPELAVDRLDPGQSTAMQVHFNSQDFQGRQLKYIKIYTDATRQRIVDFPIQATVQVPLEMHPARTMLRYPTVRGGETHTISYTFTAQEVSPLEITPTAWPEEWLNVTVKPGTSPSSVTVDFTVRADSPAGTHREALKLRTNVPEVPVVNLEADVRVVTDLVVNMDRVNLRRLREGQAVQTRVRVAPADPGTRFSLTGATIDIPGLTARIENGDKESFAVLEGEALAFDHPFAAERKGRISGTLAIQTDLASSPVLELPVTYILRR